MIQKHHEETIALFNKMTFHGQDSDWKLTSSQRRLLKQFILSREQELVRKVLEEMTDIVLAVDKIAVDRIEELGTKAEVFGYAQGFICTKLDDKKQEILSQLQSNQ